MKGEFYKMDYEAWDEGTVDLSLEQEAAYLRLCHQMYRRHSPIPNSIRLLSIIWRCRHRRAQALLDALVAAGKITNKDGVLSNSRVSQVLVERESLANKRRVSGTSGGINSGVSRSKSLMYNEHIEPNASNGFDKKEPEKSREEEIRDAALLPSSSQETEYFRRVKDICGPSAGGLAARLLKSKNGSIADARIAVEQASKRENPREYIGAIIHGKERADTQGGVDYRVVNGKKVYFG